jgi:heptosyltransferase-3
MKRVLLIKPKNIGDSLILLCATRAIPKNWIVDILCHPHSREVFANSENIDQVFVTARNKTNLLDRIRHNLITSKKIASTRYDLLIALSDYPRAIYIKLLANPSISIALKPSKNRRVLSIFFDKLIAAPKGLDAHDQDMLLLSSAGLEILHERPAFIPNNMRIIGRQHTVAIGINARWKFKELPLHVWIVFINYLIARGFSPVLIGATDDKANHDKLVAQLQTPVDRLENIALNELMIALSGIYAVVSVDSMLIHLASTIGLPAVGIFGPTDEKVWGPKGVPSVIVEQSSEFGCRPCNKDGCFGSKMSPCLLTIEPSRLISAFEQLEYLTIQHGAERESNYR